MNLENLPRGLEGNLEELKIKLEHVKDMKSACIWLMNFESATSLKNMEKELIKLIENKQIKENLNTMAAQNDETNSIRVSALDINLKENNKKIKDFRNFLQQTSDHQYQNGRNKKYFSIEEVIDLYDRHFETTLKQK